MKKKAKKDYDDIEFIEIDLDEDFTSSSHEYFSRGGKPEKEEYTEEFDEEYDDSNDEEADREALKKESEGKQAGGKKSSRESGREDDFDDSDDEEYDDSWGNDPRERNENEEERAERKRKGKKIAAIIFCSFIGALAAVYIGFTVYFGNRFLFRTTINGTEFSMKTAEEVEEYMKKQVDDYVLTIEKSDGGSEQIAGTAVSLKYVSGDELKKLVKEQNHLLWIESLWKQPKIEAPIGVEYDEKALEEEIGKLQCMKKENQIKSVDAHPEFKDTEFVVVPEVIGTQINAEKFIEAAAEAINGFQDAVNLKEAGCYKKPKYLSDSKKVIAAKDAMNSYLGANITYDFNPYTEVVDASVISKWVKVNSKMKVTFSKKAVKKYIKSLAEKYDTIAKTREFTTANGNVVSVVPGTYGWEIDQETEYKKLLSNIKKGKTVKREPEYFSRAAVHETMDMGNTYAEVDLTAQHMWLFQNGQVTLESDVVTGNPNIWNRETPSGVYSILELSPNATLVGEKDPKTGKPEYRTPVSFWMRVTWSGIGFHDATWQPYFGGDLYLSNGSHGCINMPYDKAQALFGLLEIGTPVVIHY